MLFEFHNRVHIHGCVMQVISPLHSTYHDRRWLTDFLFLSLRAVQGRWETRRPRVCQGKLTCFSLVASFAAFDPGTHRGSACVPQRQEQKSSALDEQLKEYITEWRKQRSKEEEELKRLKEKQAKRKVRLRQQSQSFVAFWTIFLS